MLFKLLLVLMKAIPSFEDNPLGEHAYGDFLKDGRGVVNRSGVISALWHTLVSLYK